MYFFISWEQRAWILWGCGRRCVECLIHWIIWKERIILSIMNSFRIIMKSICGIIWNALNIVSLKTCIFCYNPFMVSLKELPSFSMQPSVLSQKSRSDSCENFLPLRTGMFIVNFLSHLFSSISFICSLDDLTCRLSSSVTLLLLIDDNSTDEDVLGGTLNSCT